MGVELLKDWNAWVKRFELKQRASPYVWAWRGNETGYCAMSKSTHYTLIENITIQNQEQNPEILIKYRVLCVGTSFWVRATVSAGSHSHIYVAMYNRPTGRSHGALELRSEADEIRILTIRHEISPLLPTPLSPVLRAGFRLSLPIRGGEGLNFDCLGPRAARSGACPGLLSVAPTGPNTGSVSGFQVPPVF